MTTDTVQIWSTGAVLILCAIAAGIVGSYAMHELIADRRRLRGQFALGLTTLFVGISGRLGAAWAFYAAGVGGRGQALADLHVWTLSFNTVIAIGAMLCIRLVTIQRFGEWPWLAACAASALIAVMVV